MQTRMWILWLPMAVLACGAEADGCGGVSGGFDDGRVTDEKPYREDWREVVEVEFIHTAADGSPLISELQIGGGGDGGDNFSNRGDVVVLFDAPPDTMFVEVRPFTMASTDESAEEQLAKLHLWAYEGSLAPPHQKDESEDCLRGWRSGCQLRVWEDGASQRRVSGADFRIRLPADFRGRVDIETEDNTQVSDYLNRADVCIEGLPGSARVAMESGRAWVKVADTATPTPTCPADLVAQCESWTTTDNNGTAVAQPWAPECPCFAGGHNFGRVEITSRDFDATDMKIDLPAELWAALSMENKLTDALDRACEVDVVLPGSELEVDPGSTNWRVLGAFNFPGEPALRGGGYGISAASGTCQPVAHTDSPDLFVGAGNGDEQLSQRQGFVEICTDCVLPCEELVR